MLCCQILIKYTGPVFKVRFGGFSGLTTEEVNLYFHGLAREPKLPPRTSTMPTIQISGRNVPGEDLSDPLFKHLKG
jgi:hypothetical protein